MTGVGRVGRFHFRAVTAELLQRAGKSGGIARELHGGSVGEKFALAAHGGLDQATEKNADGADDEQRNPDERQRIFVAAAALRIEQNPSDGGEAQDSKKNAHELDVEPHIPVKNVAEFM